MAELNCSEEPNALPPKRKQPSENIADDSTKKLRPDNQASSPVPAAVEDKHEIEEEEEEEVYEVDEDEYDDDDDDDEAEHSNGEDEVDRKGKGIMKDDKGKGKMIEEDDSDDDDSNGGASQSDGDDDLSDDPLAEVDLDNILPSRTRRRTAPSGVRIDKNNDA